MTTVNELLCWGMAGICLGPELNYVQYNILREMFNDFQF